jgi:hypothetical protein
MSFVEISINLLNLSNESNWFKIHFERFTDKYEYKGERIKSFILFIILVLCSLILILGVLFLIYKFLIKLNA